MVQGWNGGRRAAAEEATALWELAGLWWRWSLRREQQQQQALSGICFVTSIWNEPEAEAKFSIRLTTRKVPLPGVNQRIA